MKTFRLIEVGLIAAILCFAFASCSDDDDDSAPNSIIGTWKGEYYIEDGIKCTNIITFKADGTAVSTVYEGNYEPYTGILNYVYNPSHKTITTTYYEDGELVSNTAYIEFISNNKFRVYEDGQFTIYIRTQ